MDIPSQEFTSDKGKFDEKAITNYMSLALRFQKDKDGESFEEDLEGLQGQIPDEYFEVLYSAKALYDSILLSSMLSDISGTEAPLSSSMVRRFTEHKEDLERLKRFFKSHPTYDYNSFFNDNTKPYYAGYIDGKTSQVEFYKAVKKFFEKDNDAHWIIDKIDQEDFLRKQRTFDNGAIPHQIHLAELKAIIEKQKKYYPFLEKEADRIEIILTFRIPYYVGPLSSGHRKFGWVVRKGNEAIKPWNLEEQIDKGATAEQFITRMTNRCTYLPSENVLPKHSLLYEKFMIFNELTKIRYVLENNKHFAVDNEMKIKIFEMLFKKTRKVTEKQLLAFFYKEYPDFHITKVMGLDRKKPQFNSSYATYHDLKKIVSQEYLDNPENAEEIEDIIQTLTLFEDREIIREKLSEYKDHFTKEQLKKLERRHYTGWGQLSKKLICGIRDKQTHKTIMEFLEDDGYTNRNLMQLVTADELSFAKEIKDASSIDTTQSLRELVQEIPGSPAIKKGIHQSLKIVEEIRRVMGYDPENIVIEMAREAQATAEGERRSRERMRSLEKALAEFEGKVNVSLPKENKLLTNKRLYLYYLQNGKDIYTGADLDINLLSTYDIDHIIPQSFIKDDSLDNIALTTREDNRGKLDNVPSSEVVRKMKGYWQQLLKAGLMSDRKYNNLTKAERGGLTEDDKKVFIRRQLVETRQITKQVARILDERFNHEKNESGEPIRKVRVITLKSKLVSDFRKKFELYKVREINDFHHAHDAYLNAIVGTLLLKKYPKLESEFVYGAFKKLTTRQTYEKATRRFLFYSNILNFLNWPIEDRVTEDGEPIWDNDKDLPNIKKWLYVPQVNVVKKTEVQTVGQNTISLGYTVSGTIKGKEEIPYTATSSGEVTVVNGKNGDYVNAGQVIIAIDNQAARANAMSASSNYEAARINYEKYRTLYNKRLVTETEYLNAKTQYNSAKANLNASKNNLSSARAELDSANDTNRKAVIKTNTTGTIAHMNLELHQQTSAGNQLFTVINEGEMQLEVGVSPEIISKIHVGTQAKVKIDELKGEELTGTVYEVAAAANSSSRQFTVKIKIPNSDRRLKSGMYGTASIDTGAEDGLVIPKKAIVVKGVEQVVYIVRNGKAVAIPIKITNQNEEMAAVTGNGLTAGIELIVDGQNVVQNDEKIRRVQ